MKEFGEPQKDEVDKLQQFIDGVLWGGIQISNGPLKYGVRKSLFYYDPKEFPPTTIPKSATAAGQAGTSVTPAALIAPTTTPTSSPLTGPCIDWPATTRAWSPIITLDWYLDQAFQTTKFLIGRNDEGRYNVGYFDTGLMEVDIFLMLLKELKR